MNKPATSLKLVALGMMLVGFSQQAAASGFQLFEGNAVNMGDFGAGGAAIAEDASTAFYNPAGLVRLTAPQLVVSTVGISSKTDFSGKSTWSLPGLPYSKTFGEDSASGGGFKLVPAFHYALPLNNVAVFGFSVSAPFGLATDYANDSVVRYEATKSDVKTLDISPSIGVKVNEQLSLGAGVDLQRLEATLNSTAGIPVINPVTRRPVVPVQLVDANITNVGSDWAFGWHAGALYQFNPSTRVGINYAAKVKHHLKGTSTFTSPVVSFESNDLNADINLPASTTLSAYHDLNQQWAVLASVVYTQWSSIEKIALNNVQSINAAGQPITIPASLPENFRDTWRVALGTNYKLNEQWLLRAGVGYDQTPVNAHDRGVRLPDGDRIAVAVGSHYQATKALGLDVGYTHLFIKDGEINHANTTGSQRVETVGTSKNSADLLGLQLTWSIV